MPDVEIPDVAQLVVYGYADPGVLWQSALYFRNTAAPWVGTNLTTLADVGADAWTANIAPVVSNSVQLLGTKTRDVGVSPYGPVLDNLLDTPVTGGVASEAFPYFSAAVVQFIGEVAGTPRRSYIRHIGVTEAQGKGNSLTAAAKAAIDAAWEGFVSDVIDGFSAPDVLAHVIVSTVLNGVPRAEGTSNEVDTISVRSALGKAASRSGLTP